MQIKKYLIFFFLSLTIISSLFELAYADTILSHNNNLQQCLKLGSKPSFIIKFKNQESNLKTHSTLQSNILQKISVNGVKFTASRAMAQGAYIVFFQPDTATALEQIRPGCYSYQSIDNLIRKIKNKYNVEYIDPNVLKAPLAAFSKNISNLNISSKQWDLLTAPGGINLQNAWNINTGKAKAITAVLDTGDLNNTDLNPNIIAAVSFTNNGSYVNGASPSCGSECGAYDHGTHVAGTVAASGNLAYGENIFGVAPTSKIVQVNVFTKVTSAADCSPDPAPCLLVNSTDEVNALSWLAGQNFPGISAAPTISAINMSLGGSGTCPQSEQTVLNQLFAANISVAVSAGNSNTDASNDSPANCTGVFPVAATDRNGYGAPYSNYGSIVSFAAPGGDTTLDESNGIYSTIANGFGYMQGTSMSSPHVAGLLALLYSIDPTLTTTTALSILTSTATAFPAGGPGTSCTVLKPCGAGIINAGAAALQTQSQAPTLAWTPNMSVTQSTRAKAKSLQIYSSQARVTWQAAAWQPSRNTSITYTVYLNGAAVSTCTNITSTVCNITNLAPNIDYTVYVTASDGRQIYGPIQSNSVSFSNYLPLVTPIITSVTRDPMLKSQAFVYFSNSGFIFPTYTYIVNGIIGATVRYDAANNRFVISNITSPRQITGVSIIILNNDALNPLRVQTNTFVIPGIL